MSTAIAITCTGAGEMPIFRVESASGSAFALKSVVVVDSGGVPVWEFVRATYEERYDFEVVTSVIHLMPETARDVSTWPVIPPVQPHDEAKAVHDIEYGAVPIGYRQTIPKIGIPKLRAGVAYRIVIFTSLGGGNLVFHR